MHLCKCWCIYVCICIYIHFDMKVNSGFQLLVFHSLCFFPFVCLLFFINSVSFVVGLTFLLNIPWLYDWVQLLQSWGQTSNVLHFLACFSLSMLILRCPVYTSWKLITRDSRLTTTSRKILYFFQYIKKNSALEEKCLDRVQIMCFWQNVRIRERWNHRVYQQSYLNTWRTRMGCSPRKLKCKYWRTWDVQSTGKSTCVYCFCIIFLLLVVLGMESRTSSMLSTCSTPELHPQPLRLYFYLFIFLEDAQISYV
jgi:hypothetical protein